jgi:hypothetical protein
MIRNSDDGGALLPLVPAVIEELRCISIKTGIPFD